MEKEFKEQGVPFNIEIQIVGIIQRIADGEIESITARRQLCELFSNWQSQQEKEITALKLLIHDWQKKYWELQDKILKENFERLKKGKIYSEEDMIRFGKWINDYYLEHDLSLEEQLKRFTNPQQ